MRFDRTRRSWEPPAPKDVLGNILIVEDDRDTRDTLAALLGTEGLHGRSAAQRGWPMKRCICCAASAIARAQDTDAWFCST